MPIQYILTDIEGTTTSVSFVFETLFPYFLTHIDAIKSNMGVSFVQQQLNVVKATILQEENKEIDDATAIKYLEQWTRNDRKHPALKALQGWVWKQGFENGQLKGHLYDDVPPVLEQWKQQGLGLGIYSSGSVEAQKLLFGYSIFGNMASYFTGFFDTQVGHKREVHSYQTIAQTLQIPADYILFLSDVEAELDAAQAAQMQTLHLVRENTIPSLQHRTVATFKEINLADYK